LGEKIPKGILILDAQHAKEQVSITWINRLQEKQGEGKNPGNGTGKRRGSKEITKKAATRLEGKTLFLTGSVRKGIPTWILAS